MNARDVGRIARLCHEYVERLLMGQTMALAMEPPAYRTHLSHVWDRATVHPVVGPEIVRAESTPWEDGHDYQEGWWGWTPD